jgi:hypothetical protein
MNIEWFGLERNKPDPWVVVNDEGVPKTYSDGTPKMFSSRRDAMFDIFNSSMDSILNMDKDTLADNGVTPVMMDMFVLLLHTEDLESIEEVMAQYRILNPLNMKAITLKEYVNSGE